MTTGKYKKQRYNDTRSREVCLICNVHVCVWISLYRLLLSTWLSRSLGKIVKKDAKSVYYENDNKNKFVLILSGVSFFSVKAKK